MTNFRLNLPVDIPWKFIRCSNDMMDDTWCNKKSPSPFRSSLALYAYEPKAEELPAELCGDRITYLKVSCSITGYQPEESEKEQIVRLLETAEVDYSKIEQIVGEYFGCYGVLLNVSVHPFDEALKDQFRKYPRIVDFEPKIRDFYQAASETGEVLTASIGKVSTGKSFTTTDSTQSSWQVGAKATAPPELMLAATGIPLGLEATGTTGQVRTETDQENWATATDASRERRELQSTTTQLSQMYNLLTGYHTGTNRAAFVMLPRPHILQPTDRRTFVQGLRVIEGVQDFFLVVVRPPGEDKMKVDVHLQTGHFPEDIEVVAPTNEEKYDFIDFIVPVSDSITGRGSWSIFGDKILTKRMSFSDTVVDEANGWEPDTSKGDSGHRGVKQLRNMTTVTIKEVDTETGQVLSEHEEELSEETGEISNVDYQITNGELVVTATLEVQARYPTPLSPYKITRFSRSYKVFLRRPKINVPTAVADVSGLLITQRALCAEIQFGDCIKNVTGRVFPTADGPFVVNEPPLGGLVDVPLQIDSGGDSSSGSTDSGSSNSGNSGTGSWSPPGGSDGDFGLVARTRRPNPHADFAFKKAILRKIQQVMLTAASSPFRYKPGEVGYLQTRHFQRRILKVLPDKVLDRNVRELDFVDSRIKEKVNLSLRELLSADESQAASKSHLSPKELKELKRGLFK